MSINVEISPIFGRYTNNVLNIQVSGKTVHDALQDLARQFPDLKKMILDKDGNLMQSYDFYINGENVYPRNMSQPLKDGDKLNIVYIIHGG